jgi:hypothetical protein
LLLTKTIPKTPTTLLVHGRDIIIHKQSDWT